MISRTLKEFRTSTSSKTKKLKVLYKLIQRNSLIRAETLAEKANMSTATCARLLEELSKKQLILTNELGESTGGRKPILYRINPYQGYLIGIEITNTYSTILLLNLEQDIQGRIKIKTPNIQSTYQTVDYFIAQIKSLLNEYSVSIHDVLGIGVAIDELSDRIDTTQSQVIERIANIQAYIHQRLPTYVMLGSGANFAALAEYRLHYSAYSHRFLFTSCDEEIRSCTIINEANFFNQAGIPSAFGHTTIDINGQRCTCGSFGCLHSYSSLPAIKNKIMQQIKRGKASLLTTMTDRVEDIDYYMIFQALEYGDEICVEALEDAAYYYGIALANLILTFQPDVVVCGGTLVPKGSFFSVVKKTVEDKIKIYPQLKTTIYPAKDSYDIVSRGAGEAVLEHFLA